MHTISLHHYNSEHECYIAMVLFKFYSQVNSSTRSSNATVTWLTRVSCTLHLMFIEYSICFQVISVEGSVNDKQKSMREVHRAKNIKHASGNLGSTSERVRRCN